MLNEMGPEQDLAFFSSVNLALGENASILFDQLGDDNGFMSMLGTLNMTNSDAANQIAIGLQMGKDLPGSKISIKSLVVQNPELSFLKIKQEIFTGIPFEDRGKNDAIMHRAVEAMLTYQTQTGELSTDFLELDQEQFRDIVSFALGGSKDGETGGIGQLGDENNPRYYFRPDGVSDDDFILGLESLQALHPNAPAISSILDKGDFTVAMVGTDKNRQPVYALVLPDSNDPMDMGVTKFASFPVSEDPVFFTFANLIQQASFDAQGTLKEQNIRESAVTGELKGLTTQADVEAYNEENPPVELGLGPVDNVAAVEKMLAPQTEPADAETAALQAEIAELQEGPKAGENFQESRAARKEANKPKEYTIKVYGKFDQTFTVDKKTMKIFDKNGKEIRPEDDPRFFTDIEKRIREARKSEERGVPEAATTQDDEALVVDRQIPAKRANTVLNNTTENNNAKIKVSDLWNKNDGNGRYLRDKMISGFSEKQRQSPSFHIENLILEMRDNGWKITAPEAKKMLETYKQENPDWFK
tara:strand:+ start:1 stop:1590 length:1590 start_codon:yes stop_codon:yes gene_type:complete